MSVFDCRYCNDSTGRLVHHNVYPEYVEKLYELKSQILKLDTMYVPLDNFISKIEHKLFENDGVLFKEWLKENRQHIEVEIEVIKRCLLELRDTEMERVIKEDVIVRLNQFVI